MLPLAGIMHGGRDHNAGHLTVLLIIVVIRLADIGGLRRGQSRPAALCESPKLLLADLAGLHKHRISGREVVLLRQLSDPA